MRIETLCGSDGWRFRDRLDRTKRYGPFPTKEKMKEAIKRFFLAEKEALGGSQIERLEQEEQEVNSRLFGAA